MSGVYACPALHDERDVDSGNGEDGHAAHEGEHDVHPAQAIPSQAHTLQHGSSEPPRVISGFQTRRSLPLLASYAACRSGTVQNSSRQCAESRITLPPRPPDEVIEVWKVLGAWLGTCSTAREHGSTARLKGGDHETPHLHKSCCRFRGDTGAWPDAERRRCAVRRRHQLPRRGERRHYRNDGPSARRASHRSECRARAIALPFGYFAARAGLSAPDPG